MKITWDAKAKAVYIQVTEEHVSHTGDGGGDCLLDFDGSDDVVGIEILNVDSKPEIEEL